MSRPRFTGSRPTDRPAAIVVSSHDVEGSCSSFISASYLRASGRSWCHAHQRFGDSPRIMTLCHYDNAAAVARGIESVWWPRRRASESDQLFIRHEA